MTVLVEDSIAVFAALITIFGKYLLKDSDNGFYDAHSAIIIGVSLINFAFLLAREFKALVIGKAILKQELNDISDNISKVSEIKEIFSIKTMHLSTEDILVTVDVVL